MKASVEASVEGAFITERLAKGDMHVRWMAKKIDYQTPMFNDSVIYREVSRDFGLTLPTRSDKSGDQNPSTWESLQTVKALSGPGDEAMSCCNLNMSNEDIFAGLICFYKSSLPS